jgi:hypothetical protein
LIAKAARQAVRGHLAALRDLLGCVTRTPPFIDQATPRGIDTPIAITLRDTDLARLRGENALRFVARQTVRVVGLDASVPSARRPQRVEIVSYFYQLSTQTGSEIVAFHRPPATLDPNAVTLPHLHLGPAIVAGQTTIRPRDLHKKARVPTGVVSLAAVVRLAIAEFGVVPLRTDWDRVLRAAEEAGEGS